MTQILKNDPSLWRDALPVINPDAHKYDRGVAVIYGAPKMTGATRLAARACARMGAGLVKVIAPAGTGDIYRSTLHEEVIVVDEADFEGLGDPRIGAVLFGPGFSKEDGVSRMGDIKVALGCEQIHGVVLDAGAFLNVNNIAGSLRKCALTPHEGEFAKVFSVLTGDKAERAEKAVKATGACVVLKGAQTVIAGKGETILQDRPLPQLATAGTGDVLAGMITGLIAQGMDNRMAAAASVWIHGEAAARFGVGLVASDLPDIIPAVLQDLR